MKSCKDCPSYEDDQQAIAQMFGKAPTAAVCVRFGHVLSREGQDETASDALLAYMAKDCPGHGEARNDDERWSQHTIGPVTEIMGAGEPVEPLTSCMSCSHLVKSPNVHDAFGWTLPLCRRKGDLVLSIRDAAAECHVGTAGVPTSSTTGVELRRPYRRRYRIESDLAAKALTGAYGSDVEPHEYKSDKPVSAGDKKLGIRAWRQVTDPLGKGQPVMLPIIDEKKVPETDRVLIPKAGQAEHPELFYDYAGLVYRFAVEAFMLKETVALIGAPGLGKTEVARHIAWLMGLPFHRISMNARMDSDDLLGTMLYTPEDGTTFSLGRLPQAWVSICLLLIDEPNAAPFDAWQTMRPMFDNASQMVVESAPGSPRFDRNAMCFPVLAMNPAHDDRNTGVADLAMADANRLTPVLVGDPPPAVEKEIIKRHCALDGYDIPDSMLESLVSIAADIRAAEVDGDFPDHWGIRQQVKVARKTRYYSLDEAFLMASLNFYDQDTRSLVLAFVGTNQQ